MPSSTDRTHAIPEGTPGYETSDADARGVFMFLIGLGLVVLAVVLVAWGIFRLYGDIYAPPAPASPFARERQLPSGPNLQVHPVEDLDHYMHREQQELNTYGWENRQAGTVRIPIDRAMDMVVQKGLPVAPAPDEPNAPQSQPPGNKKGVAP